MIEEGQARILDLLGDIEGGVRTCAPPSDAGLLPYPQVPDDGTAPTYVQGCRVQIPMAPDIHEHVNLGLRIANILMGGDASRDQCVDLLVQYFLRAYADEARKTAKAHPVQERDGWVCRVPGCSRRTNFEVHHIIYRSQGGDDKPPNKITGCAAHRAAHHQHGIHGGSHQGQGRRPRQRGVVAGHSPRRDPQRSLPGRLARGMKTSPRGATAVYALVIGINCYFPCAAAPASAAMRAQAPAPRRRTRWRSAWEVTWSTMSSNPSTGWIASHWTAAASRQSTA
ncbi:MAG TPA: hypothetical protein VGO93_28560 [Candidatus Xenobia bacterium]